jgi:hypothetical protein
MRDSVSPGLKNKRSCGDVRREHLYQLSLLGDKKPFLSPKLVATQGANFVAPALLSIPLPIKLFFLER